MGFNFGAFVGGFSKQLVADLEAEEERKFEMEKIAQTEAMRQRAAASSRRRSEQLATEKMMQGLSMFYNPENASRIALGGELAVENFMSWGKALLEDGRDPNTIFSLGTRNNDTSDPQTQQDMASYVPAKAPKATVTTSADEALPTETIGLGTNSFGINLEILASLKNKPEPVANSLSSMLARNLDMQQRLSRKNPNDPEIERLQTEYQNILTKAEEYAETQREKDTEPRLFDAKDIESITNSNLKQAYTRNGFQTNLEGQITNKIAGNEHRVYLAELQAAEAMREDYGSIDDPIMNTRINTLEKRAARGFVEYGNSVRYSSGANPRLKEETDPATFGNTIREGRYKAGDVIPVKQANGLVRYVIYTGFPMRSNVDKQGLPYDFLFLD